MFQPARMTPYELTAETMTAMGRVYSPKRILGLIARGKFRRTLFSLYAHRQVRRWQKENRRRLKAAKLASRASLGSYCRRWSRKQQPG